MELYGGFLVATQLLQMLVTLTFLLVMQTVYLSSKLCPHSTLSMIQLYFIVQIMGWLLSEQMPLLSINSFGTTDDQKRLLMVYRPINSLLSRSLPEYVLLLYLQGALSDARQLNRKTSLIAFNLAFWLFASVQTTLSIFSQNVWCAIAYHAVCTVPIFCSMAQGYFSGRKIVCFTVLRAIQAVTVAVVPIVGYFEQLAAQVLRVGLAALSGAVFFTLKPI